MAKGRKTGGNDFKKGWKGGPGRPHIPQDQKEAFQQLQKLRDENRLVFAEHLYKIANWTVPQLVEFAESNTPKRSDNKESKENAASVIELIVARAFMRVMNGHIGQFQTLVELMCGPEPKHFEISGPGGSTLSVLHGYTEVQLAKLYAAADKIVKESQCNLTQSLLPPSGSLPPSSPQV